MQAGKNVGRAKKVDMEDLFHDWARVARSLKKLPTMKEYGARSQYSVRPLKTRFVSWTSVPGGLKRFAEEQGLGGGMERRAGAGEGYARTTAASPLMFAGPFAQTYAGPAHVRYANLHCGARWYLRRRMNLECSFCLEQSRTGSAFLYCGCKRSFRILRLYGWWEKTAATVRIELEQESRNFMRAWTRSELAAT